MIFVLKMLFTLVYDRKNENHWSLLIIRYSLLITRNTNTRFTVDKETVVDNVIKKKHWHGGEIEKPSKILNLYSYIDI